MLLYLLGCALCVSLRQPVGSAMTRFFLVGFPGRSSEVVKPNKNPVFVPGSPGIGV